MAETVLTGWELWHYPLASGRIGATCYLTWEEIILFKATQWWGLGREL